MRCCWKRRRAMRADQRAGGAGPWRRVMFAFLLAGLSAPAWAEAPRMGAPLACVEGDDCYVRNYVDVDPGPGVADFTCGALTYDGQTSTEFVIGNPDAAARGVAAVATAEGIVRSVRDGMSDAGGGEAGRIVGRSCGNMVRLDHGDGWESVYCHLRRGSIGVSPGERVDAGHRLGTAGRSGVADATQMNLQVLQNGRVIDPFVGEPTGQPCGSPVLALWTETAAAELAYRASRLVGSGFALDPPTPESLEVGGGITLGPLDTQAPAIIFFVDLYGLRAGDRQVIRVLRVSGDEEEILVDERDPPADKARSRWLRFAGKQRPESGWPPGTYRGEFYLLRDRDGEPATVLLARQEIEVVESTP